MGIAKVKAFPRGGVPAKKGIVDKPIRKEKDLFSVGNSADIKKKKKKPRKSEKVDSSEDALKVKTVEPLTYDKLTEGFKSLARISEIRDLELKLSLPGRLVAHVPITKISDHYTENLKKVAENPDNAERLNIKSLSEMYSVGQLVSCCIETIEKEKDFYNVTATLNPSNVNENVMKGHLVMAAVKSIEDHGYSMDVGQTHLRAFLKKSSDFLSVGQVVPCYVTKNDGSAVVLKSMTSKVNSVNNFQDLSVHQMYPGMLVNAKMEGNLKNGLEMKFGDFTGK